MANIKGTKKNDDLKGTEADDVITGLGGDDLIRAVGGTDQIDAGSGDDTVIITNGASATVKAGLGKDTVEIRGGALSSTINTGIGKDTVNIAVSNQEGQTFTIKTGAGNDTVAFTGGIGLYEVTDEGGVRTVVDANGNTYILSTTDNLTFDGVVYQAPVTPPQQAPTVANAIADQVANEDGSFNFQFASNTFVDANGDELTYTATGVDGSPLPSWLVFDPETRTFSGTPVNGDVGSVYVVVTASDGTRTASDTFKITVNNINDVPTGAATADLADGNEDGSYVVSLSSLLAGFSDADGDDLSVSGLAADNGATITDNGDGTWTITPAANFHGTVGLTYTVTDGNGGSVSASQDVKFKAVNDAPTLDHEISNQTATEGEAFSFQFSGNAFSDVDDASLTYTATLANGDDLPSWLVFDPETRTFSGTPGSNDSGTLNIKITASDGSASASDIFSIKVQDVPPPPFPAPHVVAGVLMLNEDYDYKLTEAPSSGKIFVEVDGKIFSFSSGDVTSINTQGAGDVDIDTRGWGNRDIDGNVNFTNVTFVGADVAANNKFEASFEFGDFNVTGTTTVNGSMAGYFKAAWDYIDDHYSYYDEEINSFAVDIGIQYALYLKNGGTPLTDIIVKFAADNDDAGNIPQRLQSMHDNLLGNLDENSIADKFSDSVAGDTSSLYTAEEIFQRIQDAGLGDYLGEIGDINDGRGVYSGNESDIDGAAHDRVRSFDFEHGIDRPDYIKSTSKGRVDAAAIDGTEMFFGDGNTPFNYAIERHEGAGIETALKVHFRTGQDILPTLTTSDGVITYVVPEGHQQNGIGNASGTNLNRSAWSFDYSMVAGLNQSSFDIDDFDFKLKVDMDSSFGVDYQVFELLDLGPGNNPLVSNRGGFNDEDGLTANIAQNSGNFGFGFLKDNIDDGDGYDFGKGTFDIELIGYRKGTNEELSSVHIRVVVDSDQFGF